VAEAKAFELFALRRFGLPSQLAPLRTVKLASVLLQLLLMSHILFPLRRVGHVPPVAQQIRIPVLAPADAAIRRFEATNAALQVVIRTRKILPVIALHQVWTQVREHLQELAQACLLQLRKHTLGQLVGERLTPAIQAMAHGLVAHDLPKACPTAIQEMFGLQNPLAHAGHLRELGSPDGAFCHNGDQSHHLLMAPWTYSFPFFSSRCRLASISSRSSPACTAAKSNGAVPSRLSAVRMPAA
jgi:hypothetical protein